MGAAPPLNPASGRLLSDMGMRPGRTSGQPTYHAGMDLGGGGRGASVLNVQDGTVERILSDGDARRVFEGYGNGVVVNHHDGTWALYAHLARAVVPVGKVVRAGDKIGEMGNTSNGKFPGMGVHLHLELRRAKADGSSPYPGPYRTYNLDPRPWLANKGVRFGSRGGIEVVPGSPADSTRRVWSLAGVPEPVRDWRHGKWRSDPDATVYETVRIGDEDVPLVADVRHRGRKYRTIFPGVGYELRGLGEDVNAYEPPARFDRDAMFGLTPTEWAMVGAGGLVVTASAVALFMRGRMRPNRGQMRLRSWGAK